MAKFDLYTDADPSDTISMKFKTLDDVKDTINKLERVYKAKKYPHKRIFQVASILRARLNHINPPKPSEFTLADKYFNFLKKRTKEEESARFKLVFTI